MWYPLVSEIMMKLNRRSVLGAIGLVGVGTGAAFGSGAFTSTTAERAVEVNVFGGENIGSDGLANGDDGNGLNQSETNTLGDEIRSNFVDVLVDTSDFNTVSFNQTAGDGAQLDAANLFPSSNPTSYRSDIDQNYVSLVANDVRIVFGDTESGSGDSLPPNSTVDYDGLFAFETAGDFDVTFQGDGDFLTQIGGKSISSDAEFTNVTDSDDAQKNAVVETGNGTENEGLNIVIENNA